MLVVNRDNKLSPQNKKNLYPSTSILSLHSGYSAIQWDQSMLLKHK